MESICKVDNKNDAIKYSKLGSETTRLRLVFWVLNILWRHLYYPLNNYVIFITHLTTKVANDDVVDASVLL